MSDSPPPIETAEAKEAKEAAATRRRWLTLAEILAVVAVLISAATLWNSYQQRAGEEADKAAAKQQASVAARTLLLRGTPGRAGRTLTLTPADEAQTIQTQTILFPSTLEIAPVETVSEPRIQADWFGRAAIRLQDTAEESGRRRGDARMPVAIVTSFFAGGDMYRDVAIYDIGYQIEGGSLLSGRDVRLLGLSRVEIVPRERAQMRLDALWSARSEQ